MSKSKRHKKNKAHSRPSQQRPPQAAPATPSWKFKPRDKVSPAMWNAFAKSLNAEPRTDLEIVGASGLTHRLEAIAVDDKGRRIIAVVAEPDPIKAALIRSDVQATIPDARVLLARPLTVDLGVIARRAAAAFGRTAFPFKEIAEYGKSLDAMGQAKSQQVLAPVLQELVLPFADAFQRAPLPTISQIMSAVQQALHFDWSSLEIKQPDAGVLTLDSLVTIDSIGADRKNGICSIPLYDFSETDWDLFQSGTKIDDIRERLKALGIYQFFYPPADHLALGIIDSGVGNPLKVAELLGQAKGQGLPFGGNEFLQNGIAFAEMLPEMKARGLVTEGELGFETTENGKTLRATVKFKPREGVLSLLLKLVKLSIDPTKIFKDVA